MNDRLESLSPRVQSEILVLSVAYQMACSFIARHIQRPFEEIGAEFTTQAADRCSHLSEEEIAEVMIQLDAARARLQEQHAGNVGVIPMTKLPDPPNPDIN